MRMVLKGFILLTVSVLLLLDGALAGTIIVGPTNMPGSFTQTVSGFGTTAGSAYATTRGTTTGPVVPAVDQPFVTQNIFMISTVPAGLIGTADASYTHAPTVSNTVANPVGTAAGDPCYSITAAVSDANARTHISVTTAGTTANVATAAIYADSRTNLLVAPPNSITSLEGRAFLATRLHLNGLANGTASAAGTASYTSAAARAVAVGPIPQAYDTSLAGRVAGTVTLRGDSVAGGTVSGLTTAGSPALANIYRTDFGVAPTNFIDDAQAYIWSYSVSPTLATWTAAGFADLARPPVFQVQTISQADVVATRGIISSGTTRASASAEGSSDAIATTLNAAGTGIGLTGSASQNAMQNSAAEARYILDQAVGYSRVYSEANHEGIRPPTIAGAGRTDIAAFGEANAYASASRINPGVDLCYGQGNIPSATWSASLNEINPTAAGNKNNPAVFVSGNGGWVAGWLPGFRAAATLAGSQPTPSVTSTIAATNAIYTDANWPLILGVWLPTFTHYRTNGLAVFNNYGISVTAPLNPNAQTDAAGGWNALAASTARSRDDTKVIQTSLAYWAAVKWMQGMDPSFTAGWVDTVNARTTFSGATGALFPPTDGPVLGAGDRSNNYGGGTAQTTPI